MREVFNQRPEATRTLNQIQELREQAKKNHISLKGHPKYCLRPTWITLHWIIAFMMCMFIFIIMAGRHIPDSTIILMTLGIISYAASIAGVIIWISSQQAMSYKVIWFFSEKNLNLLYRELGILSDELAKHERVTASQDAVAKKYSIVGELLREIDGTIEERFRKSKNPEHRRYIKVHIPAAYLPEGSRINDRKWWLTTDSYLLLISWLSRDWERIADNMNRTTDFTSSQCLPNPR